MLIDDFMPEYDFRERHETLVAAPPDAVRRAADAWRPQESLLWRLLLRLRGLGRPAGSLREWAASMGFLCLADTGDEVLYGQAGRFWSLNERGALVSPRSVEEFRAFDAPGNAVGVMDIVVRAVAPERTLLSTETRVRATDAAARRRFGLYWLIIRPFSGLLRRSTLNGIKKRACAIDTTDSGQSAA